MMNKSLVWFAFREVIGRPLFLITTALLILLVLVFFTALNIPAAAIGKVIALVFSVGYGWSAITVLWWVWQSKRLAKRWDVDPFRILVCFSRSGMGKCGYAYWHRDDFLNFSHHSHI
ncbi:MAG: hypothetical protein WC310_05580, partial [Patescibacteria group bacterium]